MKCTQAPNCSLEFGNTSVVKVLEENTA